MNNISASKVLSSIFDIIDIKLLSKFYPKRIAERTCQTPSGKLHSNVLDISINLERCKKISPIVDITDIRVILKSVLRKMTSKLQED